MKPSRKPHLAWLLLVSFVIVVFPFSRAEAAFKLLLASDPDVIIVEDQGAGDMSPVVGRILFDGSVGSFNANTEVGLSKPFLPASPTLAQMDLASVNTSNAAGELLILLTDTDFPAMSTGGVLTGSVGGTTQGTVGFAAFKYAPNAEFGVNTPTFITIGPFTDPSPGPPGTSFSGSASIPHGPFPAPYSMTLAAGIEHGPGQQINTSFNFEIANVIPEPATLSMLGLGLLAFGASRRRARVPTS